MLIRAWKGETGVYDYGEHHYTREHQSLGQCFGQSSQRPAVCVSQPLSGCYGHRVELAVQRNEDSGLAYLKIELIVIVATKTNKKKIKLGLSQLDAIHRIQISQSSSQARSPALNAVSRECGAPLEWIIWGEKLTIDLVQSANPQENKV